MHRLLRAASYLPPGQVEGYRVAGPDEDALTLLATALERVVDRDGPRSPIPSIRVASDLPTSLDWAVGAVLGASPPIHRDVGAAISPEEGATDLIIVAGNGPGNSSSTQHPGRDGGPGEGSVALLYRPEMGASGAATPGLAPPPPSTVHDAFALYRRIGPSGTIEWVGDWSSDPSRGSSRLSDRDVLYRERPPDGVSEGAYVPRPRYVENLGSRWRFEGDRCAQCGQITFPARRVCRACGRTEGLSRVSLPRDDLEVIATTTIGAGGQPTEFDRQVEVYGPYEVVLAELAPGARVTLPVADAEPGSIRIGDRVDTRLRRLYPMDGEWRYGRKAVPRSTR